MPINQIPSIQLLVSWGLVSALVIVGVECWAPQAGGVPQYAQQPALTVLNTGDGGDHYLLLSDDEILHNGDLLNELVATNKDDIEEIMDDSPELQAALLDRVKSVVRFKTKQVNGPTNLAQSFGFPTGASGLPALASGPASIVSLGAANGGNAVANAANNPQLQKLKKKLLNKTAKLVKISAPLKTKIVTMLLKKLKKKLKKLKKLKMKLGQQQPGIPKLPGTPGVLPGAGIGVGGATSKLVTQPSAKPGWHVSFSGSG